jgi:PAS domain S-box-containing protein
MVAWGPIVARARGALARAMPLLRSKTLQYSALGFVIGLALTAGGYLVDFYSLYKTLPETIGLVVIEGLHQVTPVHYFTDGFALILAVVGGIAGRLQDRLLFYSAHLEDLVAARTRALGVSEERYALAARGANDGLWDWDLVRGKVYYSPRWKQTLGHRESEIGDDPEEWLGRVHPDDRAGLEARVASHLASGTAHLSAEYRMRHADGSYRWMLARGMAVHDEVSGKAYRVAGSQTDVDERKKMEEQYMHLALHDPLTGLPNRTLFFERLGRAFARARKRAREESLAIIFVDLDRFKNINDSLGHLVGDRVLQMAAERIRGCLEETGEGMRSTDDDGPRRRPRGFDWTMARMGGDEFTLLLEDIESLNTATEVARRVEGRFREPFRVEGRELYVTLSTGIVLGPGEYQQAENLLRDADTAMYRAKAQGRGRFAIFDEKMLARAQEVLRLENDLHLALERREFLLLYQPIVELAGERLRGFEALLRWRHPERGLIGPERFIPLAEETGLIVPLGRWILAEAFGQLRRWHDLDPVWSGLTLSVNLSLPQIYDTGLEADIVGLAKERDLDPRLLHLEITENTLIEHTKHVIRVLQRLQKKGFRVAVDDFGTGYSSLAALQSLPVDILKIDQVFVAQMSESHKARQIIATILGLARALDHEVIAEGVETQAQARELRRLRCALGQGHLFSPPVDGATVETEILARYQAGQTTRRRAGARG